MPHVRLSHLCAGLLLSLVSDATIHADEATSSVLTHRSSTTITSALGGAASIAVSPDGTRLYAAAVSDNALAVFTRDPVSGALSQLDILVDDSSGNMNGLSGISDIVVHPAGGYIYTAALNDQALSVFEQTNDGLQYVETVRSGTNGVTGLSFPFRIAISPEGSHLYVATRDAEASDAVISFRIASDSGALSFLDRHDGLLDNVSALRFSADGAQLYIADATDLVVMRRDIDPSSAGYGTLSLREFHRNGENGVSALNAASAIAIAADGAHLYVVSPFDDALGVFERNADTGSLTFVNSHSGENSGIGTFSGALALAASPDGGHLYLADTLSEELLLLRRDRDDGSLSLLERHSGNTPGAALNRIATIAVSPDGAQVYTASLLDPQIDAFDVAAADLAVTLSASSPAARNDIALGIIVDNHGPTTAHRVRLSAPLPAGVTTVTAIETPADFACEAESTRVVCTAATLDAGESRQLRLSLAAASGVSLVSGTVLVSADERDAEMANNRDAASVAIIAEPPAVTPRGGGGGAADPISLLIAILMITAQLLYRRAHGTVRQ